MLICTAGNLPQIYCCVQLFVVNLFVEHPACMMPALESLLLYCARCSS